MLNGAQRLQGCSAKLKGEAHEADNEGQGHLCLLGWCPLDHRMRAKRRRYAAALAPGTILFARSALGYEQAWQQSNNNNNSSSSNNNNDLLVPKTCMKSDNACVPKGTIPCRVVEARKGKADP